MSQPQRAGSRSSRPANTVSLILAVLFVAFILWRGGLIRQDENPAEPHALAPTAVTADLVPVQATAESPAAEPAQESAAEPTEEPAQKPTDTPAPTATTAPTATAKPAPTATVARASNLPTVDYDSLPPQARETIALIDAGGPFPYSKDGSTFQNREGILPNKPQGYYSEYTVITPGSNDRGARRIVAGDKNELYYTDDHYDSFREVIR